MAELVKDPGTNANDANHTTLATTGSDGSYQFDYGDCQNGLGQGSDFESFEADRGDVVTQTSPSADVCQEHAVNFTLLYRLDLVSFSRTAYSTANGLATGTLTLDSYAPSPAGLVPAPGDSCVYVTNSYDGTTKALSQIFGGSSQSSSNSSTAAARFSYTLTLPPHAVEGTYTLQYVTKECIQGTVLSAVRQAQYIVDNTAPTIASYRAGPTPFIPATGKTTIGASLSDASSLTWTITVQDDNGTTVHTFNGAGTSVSHDWNGTNDSSHSAVEDGRYDVQLQVTDAAGNTSSQSLGVAVTASGRLPSTAPAGSVYTETLTLQGTKNAQGQYSFSVATRTASVVDSTGLVLGSDSGPPIANTSASSSDGHGSCGGDGGAPGQPVGLDYGASDSIIQGGYTLVPWEYDHVRQDSNGVWHDHWSYCVFGGAQTVSGNDWRLQKTGTNVSNPVQTAINVDPPARASGDSNSSYAINWSAEYQGFGLSGAIQLVAAGGNSGGDHGTAPAEMAGPNAHPDSEVWDEWVQPCSWFFDAYCGSTGYEGALTGNTFDIYDVAFPGFSWQVVAVALCSGPRGFDCTIPPSDQPRP